jgi:hypothetical protein
MAWHNTDLARPDTLYREHFQRAEERLQVAAKTTLGRHHPVPSITRAVDDELVLPPAQPIARPAKNATPGAASGSSRPRTIGSTHPAGPLGKRSMRTVTRRSAQRCRSQGAPAGKRCAN